MAADVDAQPGAEHSILEIDLDRFVKRKMGYLPFSRWEMIKQYKYFFVLYLILFGSIVYIASIEAGYDYVFIILFSLFLFSIIIMLVQDSMTALEKRFDWESLEKYLLRISDNLPIYEVPVSAALQAVKENLHAPYSYRPSREQRVKRKRLRITSGIGFVAGSVLFILSFYLLIARAEDFAASLAGFALVATLSVLVLCLSMWLLARSVRISQPTANQILASDPRKPILFLRSFVDDTILVRQCAPFINSRRLPAISLKLRFEEAFSDVTNAFGPLVALGDPDEKSAQLGAARDYFADDKWQERILGWLNSSLVTFLVAGRTYWVKWELENMIENDQLDKLVVLFPPKGRSIFANSGDADRSARWESFVSCFANSAWGPALENVDPVRALLAFFHGDHFVIITCDQDWENDYKLAIILALYGMYCHSWESA